MKKNTWIKNKESINVHKYDDINPTIWKTIRENAVINYTNTETPFTRIIEHKHFEGSESEKTIITKEYPKTWSKGEEAYYPMNDEKNTDLFEKYQKLAEKEDNVIFGGRLGMYQYFDMWQVIDEALKLVKKLKN